MRRMQLDYPVVRGADKVSDRLGGRRPLSRDRSDVIFAQQALGRQQFAEAERHLRRALDAEPESSEARTLMGVLHERLGEFHAAYQCYKLALKVDRHDRIALAGLRRYCERFGFDFDCPAINPTLEGASE